MEARAKEKVKKWRIVEKKEKLEYIQWLWDEVIVEDTTLLEGAEESQVVGSKYKEAPLGDDVDC